MRVVTQLPQNQALKILEQISLYSSLENALTPRTKRALLRRLQHHELAVAFDDNALAGWGLIEPLGKGVKELGYLYVKPEFRSTNAFKLLARELVLRPETVLFATYDRRLFNYVQRVYGFRESTLKEFTKISRGRFLMKRMNLDALRSIRNRMQESQPIYAILERS